MMSESFRVTWARELGERQLGGVPLAVEREACEDLVMAEHRPDGLDAFGLHGAEAEVRKWS